MYFSVLVISFLLIGPSHEKRSLRQQQKPNHENQDDYKSYHKLTKTVTGKSCHLPVKHAGELYHSCVPDIDGHYWCPISENGPWERCDDSQPELVVGHEEEQHSKSHHNRQQQQHEHQIVNESYWKVDDTGRLTQSGVPCVFPIFYMGEVLYDCVSDVSGYEWCPTINGDWQRCAGSQDWLQEVAEKYVNQVDEHVVLPSAGGKWITPIDDNHHYDKSNHNEENQYRDHESQYEGKNNNHQTEPSTDTHNNVYHEEYANVQNHSIQRDDFAHQNDQQAQHSDQSHYEHFQHVHQDEYFVGDENLSADNQYHSTQVIQPKSSLSRKSLFQGSSANSPQSQSNSQSKQQNNSSLIAIVTVIPIVSVLAVAAILVESKYSIISKATIKIGKNIRKHEKKYTVQQTSPDLEQNYAGRHNSQQRILEGYQAMRSDTQITAVKLPSSSSGTITRRHTSGSQRSNNDNQQYQQQVDYGRPDYHVRRSRSQVYHNDMNRAQNVPTWIQNTDDSFWTDISGGVPKGQNSGNWDMPKQWAQAFDKIEKIQEERRTKSNSPRHKK
eukprot:TRINITY_DN2630_c0_g1_i1.p1 TRINITY_DN2630_c0_g1~~TRINITY_DN2630_c0_g1_i1.p1  ORF type:complete len:554 (+),score=38.18 TRINITY_DN2630_c0_g1_i1:114-1775(+)